ncbi:MAG: ATPase [Bacteroidetes bacterium]|nr:MAG: ATPase [Bacteroidota bacterium]
MKLIADSGSTKTSWHLISDSVTTQTDCETAGINPFFQQSSDIVKTLATEFSIPVQGLDSIYFYGAGAANEAKKQELFNALQEYFKTETIIVESDLLAAAHSLCGNQPGIAAIMGTGSNSCYYDGTKIVANVSPLGYILGDEGSGAVLGRKLLSEILKNQFPQHLIKLFFETCSETPAQIMENVYRKPFPNRYMARFTRFLSANIQEEAVHNLVLNSFVEFYQRNIKQYSQAGNLPVHFTGSIAWHFREVLKEAAEKTGFSMGKVCQHPMEGLISYHRQIQQ